MTNPYIDRAPIFKVKENDICAEIGVWRGDFSNNILNKQPKELHLIDSWEWDDDWDAGHFMDMIKQKGKDLSDNLSPQQELDTIYNYVQTRFQQDSNVIIHRNLSTAVKFPLGYFDWVYIDGDHSYQGATKDLEYYYPLIKKGGHLCGDDYGDFGAEGGPGRAVDEFVERHQLELHTVSDVFNPTPNWTPQFIIPL
jgi:hypothetical protein